MPNKNTEVLSVSLPPDLVANLKVDATLSARSVSGQVKFILGYYFELKEQLAESTEARKQDMRPENDPPSLDRLWLDDWPGPHRQGAPYNEEGR